MSARCAARRRVGATSVAAIEPLVSLASMIEAVLIGTATTSLRTGGRDDQHREREREHEHRERGAASAAAEAPPMH